MSEDAKIVDLGERRAQIALDGLDAEADKWANDVGLPQMVMAVVSKPDRNIRIHALVRQAFVEGAYRAATGLFDEQSATAMSRPAPVGGEVESLLENWRLVSECVMRYAEAYHGAPIKDFAADHKTERAVKAVMAHVIDHMLFCGYSRLATGDAEKARPLVEIAHAAWHLCDNAEEESQPEQSTVNTADLLALGMALDAAETAGPYEHGITDAALGEPRHE